jgi:hypothetical protein
MDFYLLFVAPCFQIVLSALRITKRISVPLGVIAFISVFAGILASMAAFNISNNKINAAHIKCLDCGMISISIFAMGLIIAVISAPIIGLIGYAIFILKQKADINPISPK